MLGQFEKRYGKIYSDFEKDFPDDADMHTHEGLVEWAFWDRVAKDCSAAIEGYRLLIRKQRDRSMEFRDFHVSASSTR
jgi:hypothetical protein